MKTILTIALWLGSMGLLAQPVLEHTYSESATTTYLETLGEVYYAMDAVNRQCHIYGMDHTLLKTISLPTQQGYYLSDVQFVSENLFNEDNLVELVYISSKYVPTSYYYIFEAKLINENGTVILDLPGVGYTDVVVTASQEMKFLAYEYDYSLVPYRTKTLVHSLPGGSTKAASQAVSQSGVGNAYPNPASRQVIIPVSLPEGTGPATLVVTDLQGRNVMNYPVNSTAGHVVLPARELSPGTYLYHVRTGNTQSGARKIVIR